MVTAQARPTVVPPSDSVGSSQSSLTVHSIHAARYSHTNKQTNKKQTQKKRIRKAILVSILILIFIYFYFFILRNSPFCPSESHTPYLSHRSGDTSEQVLSGQVVGEGALSRQGEGVPPPGSSLVRGGHHYEYYQVGKLHSHFTISTQH